MTPDPGKIVASFLDDGLCVYKGVFGESMEPFLPSGTRVKVEPARHTVLHHGDIVLLKSADGRTKVHRIALLYCGRDGQRRVLTWGDNCTRPDESTAVSNVLGKVTALETSTGWQLIHKRKRSYCKFFLRRYAWFFLLVGLRKAKQFMQPGAHASGR